nr:ABC-three component system protein [Frigoribacterium sp. CFBP 13707]
MRGMLWAHLHDLHGNAFQSFFHDLMVLCVPGFVDVRTHGNLGDIASDGLDLHDGKLYACYAPETVNASATIAKFTSDFSGAMMKRSGQFTTFVFVHNDVRGVHPEISTALADARTAHPGIAFELMGMRHFRDLLGRQDSQDVEALLKSQLPMHHAISVGLQEMEELLADLASLRVADISPPPVETVSVHKLRYSELTEESQAELRDGMRHSVLISDYYQRRIDIAERDDVAARFHAEYADAVGAGLEPEDVLLRLREFLAGNRMPSAPSYRAQTAVLAYFFESCDIFENAPEGWEPALKVTTS